MKKHINASLNRSFCGKNSKELLVVEHYKEATCKVCLKAFFHWENLKEAFEKTGEWP